MGKKLFSVLESDEGRIFIVTKTRWMGVFPRPHTSVMPYSTLQLKRLGTFIRWSARDPESLEKLHNAIVQCVQENGISGLAEFVNGVKKSEQVWKALPESGPWLLEMVRQASEDGVEWPLPVDVLRQIRKFG